MRQKPGTLKPSAEKVVKDIRRRSRKLHSSEEKIRILLENYFLPGDVSDTSNDETWKRLGIEKAAIVWIDCDLYASARDALAGLTGLLQDGTILIFDDWFTFRGNPRRGEQRAFNEWRETVADFDLVEFHQEGVWRKSFIAAARETRQE